MGSLSDEIKTAAPLRTGPVPWYERLPAHLKNEVDDIRDEWRAGKTSHTKASLSRSLSKALSDRGYPIGYWGVARWLEKA